MTNNEKVFFNVKSIKLFKKVKFDDDGNEIHVLSLIVDDVNNITPIRFYSDENVRIYDVELMKAVRKLIEFEDDR